MILVFAVAFFFFFLSFGGKMTCQRRRLNPAGGECFQAGRLLTTCPSNFAASSWVLLKPQPQPFLETSWQTRAGREIETDSRVTKKVFKVQLTNPHTITTEWSLPDQKGTKVPFLTFAQGRSRPWFKQSLQVMKGQDY